MGEVVAAGLVSRILNDQLDIYWPRIEAEMDRVPHIWNQWWTKEVLYHGIMLGRFQLWVSGTNKEVNLVVVTQIVCYPANTVLQAILALGNTVEENLPGLAGAMENFARESKCQRFEVLGRRGWARKLRKYRPVRESVVLTFEVSNERMH